MKALKMLIPLLAVCLLSACTQKVEKQEFEEQAKSAIKEFATGLKAALMAAMQQGGPTEAIPVCSQIAPSLAAEISKKYGMEIRRTSLRVRNPDNAADEWETAVLHQFQTRLAEGEAIQSLSFSERVNSDSGEQWRMMKAIPTDKICLSCHGKKIAEPVQAVLDKYYPHDQATGFKLGEIRGAFTVAKDIAPQ